MLKVQALIEKRKLQGSKEHIVGKKKKRKTRNPLDEDLASLHCMLQANQGGLATYQHIAGKTSTLHRSVGMLLAEEVLKVRQHLPPSEWTDDIQRAFETFEASVCDYSRTFDIDCHREHNFSLYGSVPTAVNAKQLLMVE